MVLLLLIGMAAMAQAPPDEAEDPDPDPAAAAEDPPEEPGGQPAAAPTELLIADFEDEADVKAFNTSDSARTDDPDGGRPLVYVFLSGLTPDEGGEHSLHMMFNDGENAWAAATTTVDGAQWAAAGIQTVAFLANSYLGTLSIDVVLATADDRRFVATVEVPSEGWVPVVVPLSAFVNSDGEPVTDALESIVSLGFEKRGTWRGCVLRIDQLRASPEADGGLGATPVVIEPGTEGPEVPDPGTPDPGTPGPGTEDPDITDPVEEGPETPADAYTVSLSTVFQPRENPIYFRTYLGMNVTSADTELLGNPRVQSMVRAIDPIIRLVVDVPADPGDDQAVHARLDALIAAVRKVAKDRGTLVCVNAPIGGDVSDRRFAEFAAGLVRRYNFGPNENRVPNPIRYWELLAEPIFLTDEDYGRAARMYNLAGKAMRGVDPEIRLGGMSLFASEQQPMDRVLRGTKGLMDFLSWHFYGAAGVSVSNEELLKAADSGLTYGVDDAIAPTRILELLRVADLYESGLLFVSECNLNKARTNDGRCQDPRASTNFAAAWLASYFVSAGTVVDVTLLSRLSGESWGMIHQDGSAGPVYWTARLFQDHMPRGTEVLGVRSTTRRERMRALAGILDDRRMVLMVNREDQPAEVELTLSGLGPSYAGTLFHIAADGESIQKADLVLERPRAGEPGTRAGTLRASGIVLPPYGVGIAEFRPRGALP
ncbi:MAG: hypothetical protein GF320_07955 [Armatimonadia bacterium]|nr:hypothetical protein [Armatimonadia bacterium]